MISAVLKAVEAASFYRVVIATNIVAFVAVILHRFVTPLADSEYVHRLVSYDNGLIRRGLVGEIYSWFADEVSPWAVRIEGLVTIALVMALFVLVFARTYRLPARTTVVLACFLFGSPLLFKNFIGNLGKFDVLGAAVAMLAVLMPLRRAGVALAAALCAVLLFVHHLHATIYIPTVYGILLLRLAAGGGEAGRREIAVLAGTLALLVVLFGYLLTAGVPALSEAEFMEAVRERATHPVSDRQAFMWYSTIGEEIAISLSFFGAHMARLPLYAAVVLIHAPVILFLARRLAPLAATHPASHRLFLLVVAVVVAGYVATNVVTFDYARHLGNLALCLLLLAQAQIIATAGPIETADDLDPADRRVMLAAASAAALPWVGTVFPLI